jgi:hypothetical protein
MDRLNAYICFNMRAAMKKIDRLFSRQLEEIGDQYTTVIYTFLPAGGKWLDS